MSVTFCTNTFFYDSISLFCGHQLPATLSNPFSIYTRVIFLRFNLAPITFLLNSFQELTITIRKKCGAPG